MRIRRLLIRNYRLLSAIDIEPSSGLNVLFGDNAAGKTSLLETLIGLSRGRVPNGNPKACCGPRGSAWRIEAWRGEDENGAGGLCERLRMQWEKSLALTINELPANARGLSRLMIAASVDPRSHELLDYGPSQRRRFLDWALFHVEPAYAEAWSRWRRALEQRNKALVSQGNSEATWAWDQSLVGLAMAIHQSRRVAVEAIAADLKEVVGDLFEPGDVNVDYEAGWNVADEYEAVLQKQRQSDVAVGRTRMGPQRADLKIQVGGMDAEKLSRGQQKLLLCGLMISASRYVARKRGSWPVLLLDDFESELGAAARSRLSEMLTIYPGQIFVTQHQRQSVLTSQKTTRLFHVEHGKVTLTIQ